MIAVQVVQFCNLTAFSEGTIHTAAMVKCYRNVSKARVSLIKFYMSPGRTATDASGLDCICLTTTHVFKDILAVFHK